MALSQAFWLGESLVVRRGPPWPCSLRWSSRSPDKPLKQLDRDLVALGLVHEEITRRDGLTSASQVITLMPFFMRRGACRRSSGSRADTRIASYFLSMKPWM